MKRLLTRTSILTPVDTIHSKIVSIKGLIKALEQDTYDVVDIQTTPYTNYIGDEEMIEEIREAYRSDLLPSRVDFTIRTTKNEHDSFAEKQVSLYTRALIRLGYTCAEITDLGTHERYSFIEIESAAKVRYFYFTYGGTFMRQENLHHFIRKELNGELLIVSNKGTFPSLQYMRELAENNTRWAGNEFDIIFTNYIEFKSKQDFEDFTNGVPEREIHHA